jgi:hypothetical protein
MVNETSPIIDYFPPEFDSDLNGKQQEWEVSWPEKCFSSVHSSSTWIGI